MPAKKYNGSEFVPSPFRQWDASFDHPFWRGVTPKRVNAEGDIVDSYLDDGLVLHFDFTAHSVGAGVVGDLSGNGNDGIISNSAETYHKQAIGRELEFDGTDDSIVVPHSSELNVQTGDFTIFLRVRLADNNNRNVFVSKKGESGLGAAYSGYTVQTAESGFISASHDSQPLFYFGDGSSFYDVYADANLPIGGLYDLSVRHRASDGMVWMDLDGQPVLQTQIGGSSVDNTYDLHIGHKYNNNGNAVEFLNGGLTELRIYNRLLSDAEINGLAEPSRSRQETWRFGREETVFDTDHALAPAYDPDRANPYQLAIRDVSADHVDHYETDVIDGTWTLVSSDIMPGGFEAQTIIIDGGTYYVWDSDDTSTNVWSGPNLSNLTDDGKILDKGDGGAYHDGSKWYYFAEGDTLGVGGKRIDTYTASSPTGSYSLESTAIDVTDRYNDYGVKIGDADVYKDVNGVYWMFFDVTSDHPEYSTGIARSTDLLDWEWIEDSSKNYRGGDLKILDDGTDRWAFCEYGGKNVGDKGTARFSVTKIT